MSFCSIATTTTNTGMFTVMMRIRRKAGKLASAGGRLPSKELALGVNEQPMRGARRSYFGAQDQGAAIGYRGHPQGFRMSHRSWSGHPWIAEGL
jgi:hypothetical protein